MKKINLIVMGVVLAFILLEGMLRFGGYLYISWQEYQNSASIRENGEYIILCLGESTTQDSIQYSSWPRYLEKYLNARLDISFSVINKGISGTNTDIIMSKLPEYLEQYQPNMIIAMMGINDNGDFLKYENSAAKSKKSFIHSYRTVKLIKLIGQHVLNKVSEKEQDPQNINIKQVRFLAEESSSEKILERARSYFDTNQFAEALVFYKQIQKGDPKSEEAMLKIALCYKLQNEPEASLEVLKRLVELYPLSEKAHRELSHVYHALDQASKARAHLMRAEEISRSKPNSYFDLARYHWRNKDYSEAEEMYMDLIKNNPEASHYALLAHVYHAQNKVDLANRYFKRSNELRASTYNPQTKHNYQMLKNIAEKENIKLVCMQYPIRGLASLKNMLVPASEVIFIDNELIFKDAIKTAGYDEYFCDIFGGDFGHTTTKGNQLLADNIANVLFEYLSKYQNKY